MGAEPGGKVGYGPERSIVVAAFKADPTERCMSRLDANTQGEFTSKLSPHSRQLLKSLAYRNREPNGLQLVLRDEQRIVEEDHHAVSGEMLERALVARDELPERGVVLAQHIEEVFGSCRLRECREVADIAEEAGDVRAVPRQKLLTIGRGDELRD